MVAGNFQTFDAPYNIVMMRIRRADKVRLTYEDLVVGLLKAEWACRWQDHRQEGHESYARMTALEILERGLYLSAADTERIAKIIAKRPVRY